MHEKDLVSETFESELKRNRKSQILSFVILFLLILAYSLWKSHGVDSLKMQWTDESLIITDPSGETKTLQLAEIKSISYHPDWNVGTCSDISEDRFYRYGICKQETIGSYYLYAANNCSSVILFQTDTESVAVSYESDTVTQKLYDALPETFDQLGFSPEIRQ